MTEHFIHYEGRDFTPLEFSELIAQKVPGQAREAIDTQIRLLHAYNDHIKVANESIELAKKLIVNDPKNRELHESSLELSIRGKEQSVRAFNQGLNFLFLLFLATPQVDELAKIIQREVDSLK